jgi:hypothetical protein
MRERPIERDDSSTDPEPPRSGGPSADDTDDADAPHHESHDPYQPL